LSSLKFSVFYFSEYKRYLFLNKLNNGRAVTVATDEQLSQGDIGVCRKCAES
jgi:hypothetical protein